MPYVVTPRRPITPDEIWDKILTGVFVTADDCLPKPTTGTITHITQDSRPLNATRILSYIQRLEEFNTRYASLFDQRRESLYHKFYIPKRHGGKREIDEPLPELKTALNDLKALLESFWPALYHTSAFAYVKGRCIRDLNLRHTQNGSNWFLKTDFSGFFPSSNLRFVMDMLSKIVPFSQIAQGVRGWAALEKAISLAMLNDGLPQGSPLSPMLSNIIMIPIDHRLFNLFAKQKMVYTRYADDITVSAAEKFNPATMVNEIEKALCIFNAPYTIKPEKTKFVSAKGPNWNLGLMVNKDHQVTVGHDRKKLFRAAVNNFILDYKNNKYWSAEDAMELQGKLAYYQMVEKDYFLHFQEGVRNKYHVDLKTALSSCISSCSH